MASDALEDGTADDGRLAFRVAYDGRAYHGFQRQPDVPTVEGALFDALGALDLADGDETLPGYAAAGRTDAGVSALAQTVAVTGPTWLTPAALNAELPADVRAWARVEVPEAFHPRHDAVERTYIYYLSASGIDIRRARWVCAALEGTYDFHNLTADSGETVRTVTEAGVEPAGPFLRLVVRGPGFLRQQVRRIASLVRTVGRGDRPRPFVDRVLSTEALDGADGIPPSSPEPLVLSDVRYAELSFDVDPEVRAAVQSTFAARRRHHAAVSRAMGTIAAGLAGSGQE